MLYTIILLLTSTLWQRILRRFSWIKTFGIAVLLFVPTEFAMFMLTPSDQALYVGTALVQQILCVGLNFSYANILYMNLPEENSTAHVSFNTIGCNVFAFFGMLTGTWISSLSGDNMVPFFGMEVYTVQHTTLVRAATLFTLGLLLILFWKKLTPDNEIAEVEKQAALSKWKKEQKAALLR